MQQLRQWTSAEWSRYKSWSNNLETFALKLIITLNNPLYLFLSAPCPPDSVDVELFTMQNETQMLYFNWSQITCRDTEYLLELNGSLLGDSQALFEISSYWTSMTHFEIPLPCGSSYWATVESRNTGGTSQPSVPLSGTTGKLHLTLKLLFKHSYILDFTAFDNDYLKHVLLLEYLNSSTAQHIVPYSTLTEASFILLVTPLLFLLWPIKSTIY